MAYAGPVIQDAPDQPVKDDQPFNIPSIPATAALPPQTAADYEPVDAPSTNDYFHNIRAGWHSDRSKYYSLQAQHTPNPEMQKYYDDMAGWHQQAGQYEMSQMSDGGRRVAETGEGHPFHSMLMGITRFPAEQATTLGTIGAAGAIGGLIGGPPGAAAAAYATGIAATGVDTAAGAVNTARNYILNQASEDELMKDPGFAARSKTMSDEDNRRVYANQRIHDTGLELQTFVPGALMGAAGAEEAFGVAPFLAKGIVRRAVTGAGIGAAGGALSTDITDMALGAVTPGLQKTPEETAQDVRGAAVSGAEQMAGLGIFGGITHRGEAVKQAQKYQDAGASAQATKAAANAEQKAADTRLDTQPLPRSDAQLDTKARPGEFTPVGSDVQGRKEEARVKPPGDGRPSEAEAGPAAAGGIVDDAAKAAMQPKPEPITPGVTPDLAKVQADIAARQREIDEAQAKATAYKPPEPPPEPTPSPVPSPTAAPTPAPEPTPVPESQATIQAQLQYLMDGQRQAVLIPTGSARDIGSQLGRALKAHEQVGKVTIPKMGSIYFRTDELSHDDVRGMVKGDRLNELLEYGPVGKKEAIADQEAGHAPAAVVERKPDGTEVKTVGGTTKTLPEQVAAVEAAKAEPTNTVGVERPDDVIAQRTADRATEDQAARAGLAAAQVTPPTPRVLRDYSVPAARGYVPPGITETIETPAKRGKRPKEQAARAANNEIADSLIKSIPITKEEVSPAIEGKGNARADLLNKLNTMLETAKANGWKEPERIQENVDPRDNHSKASLALKEAQYLVNYWQPGRVPRSKEEATNTFALLHRRLGLIEEGNLGKYIEDRKTEVKEAKGLPDVGKKEVVERVKTAEEEEKEAAAEREKAFQAEEAAKVEARRKESEEMRKAAVTPEVTEKPKFTVVQTKRRMPKEQKRSIGDLNELRDLQFEHISPEDLEGLGADIDKGGTVTEKDDNGKEQELNYDAKTTLKQALSSIDTKHYPRFMRPLISKLIDHISTIVGDTDVYMVRHEEMQKLDGTEAQASGWTKGLYNANQNHVILNTLGLVNPRDWQTTILHEAFHAATTEGMRDKVLRGFAGRLYNEVMDTLENKYGENIPQALRYGMHDPDELLTEIVSNPAWQKFLKSMNISKELATDMEIPKWRKVTMFQAALDWFRKLLKLTPRDYNALEAAFSLGEKAMWFEDPTEELRLRQRAKELESRPTFDTIFSEPVAKKYSRSIEDGRNKIAKAMEGQVAPRVRGAARFVKELVLTPPERIQTAEEQNWGGGEVAKVGRKIQETMDRIGATRSQILKRTEPLMNALVNLQAKYPDQYAKLGDLLVKSTTHGVDARDELGTGKNKFINPRDEDSRMRHFSAIQNHPELHANYNELNPIARELYNEVIDTFHDTNQQYIAAARKNLINKIMNKADLTYDRRKAIDKIINKEELDEDEQERFGDDDYVQAIKAFDNATRRSLEGPYFSLQRFEGPYVVTGEHEYEPAGRETQDPHTHAFDTRKQAFDFVGKLGLIPSQTQIVRSLIEHETGERSYTVFDEKLGRHRDVRASDIPATGQTMDEEYHVTVNPKHFEFADDQAHGEEIRRAMKAAGIKKISDVLPADIRDHWGQGINATQIESALDRIDRMKNLTRSEKEGAKEGLKHIAAISGPGNKLSSNFLQREGTLGASRDTLRVMDRFRKMTAGAMAKDPYRAELEDNLERLHDLAATFRGPSEHGQEIQDMYNAFKQGVNGFEGQDLNNFRMNRWFSLVAAANNMRYLVSPSYFLLHQLHLPTRVAPDLAAEVGGVQASNILQKVMRGMAGPEFKVIGKSYISVLTKAWRYDFEPTNHLDALRGSYKGLTDYHNKVLDYLMDRNILQNTGIDYSQSYGRMGVADRMALKARNISQEALGGAELTNKFASALVYAEAAAQKGLKGEDAYRYVADHIIKTSGVYSAFYRSKLLQSPMLRGMLQYRQWPMLLAKSVFRNMYNSIHPSTPWEVRARAFRELGYMVLSASMLSGVQGGTPYPVRMLDDFAHLLGIGEGWNKHMDELRHGLVDTMGVTGAGMMMDGVGSLAGVYLGHRGGISDPLGLNYFLESKPDEGGFLKWMAGAPAGGLADTFGAIQDATSGDLSGMLQRALPRVLSDPIKAYQDYVGGVTTRAGKVIGPQLSLTQVVEEGLGLTPIARQRAYQARAVMGAEKLEMQQERTRLSQLWASGDRGRARQLLQEFNARYPDNRTNLANIIKSATRPTILGYPETPKTRRKYLEEERYYGLQE